MRTTCITVLLVVASANVIGAASLSLRYFYDDSRHLYRVLDNTGNLVEYDYDPAGNIKQITRSAVPSSQLTIFNTTPSTLLAGATITIQGQNFSTTASGDAVTIGGVAATVISATATQLVVVAPNTTSGGAISVTVGGVTATWTNTIDIMQPPVITGISPPSGKKGTTVTIAVSGQNLLGATFALQSVDPADTKPPATATVVSTTATTATLTLVLGATEGGFALVGTNSVGASAITPAALFLIGPTTSTAGFYTSVLNTSFNPANVPPLPAGQNSASFYTSVLNSGFNPANAPALPAGQNSASFYTSVLNSGFNPANAPALPAGQNSASFYTSVLNSGFNTTNAPSLPAGQNSASFYTSVLNSGFNPANTPSLPAGQNSVSYFISVCNTSSGCTAMAPALVSANGSPSSTRPRPAVPSQSFPSTGSLPVLEPLEGIATVTAGQTIRLGARNVGPGSIVEFDVNQAAIAKVTEPPYETLFTVPDGPADLALQIVVQAPDQPERLSQIVRMTVVPDTGAAISGSVVQNADQSGGGIELSLAAGGLKAEFFHLAQPVTSLPSLDAVEPVRSGYVTAINEPNPRGVFGDDPLGAQLGSDYAVRFSGEVRADAAGQYRFWLAARSGAAILIDGKLLADSGLVTGEAVETPVSLALNRGWHSIEVIYYLAVGASSVRLDWQQPNSERREVLGPEYLRTALAGMKTVSAADGTFAFPLVPAKFDSVWIRAKQGSGFIEFPAVKPGAGPVSLAVPK